MGRGGVGEVAWSNKKQSRWLTGAAKKRHWWESERNTNNTPSGQGGCINKETILPVIYLDHLALRYVCTLKILAAAKTLGADKPRPIYKRKADRIKKK